MSTHKPIIPQPQMKMLEMLMKVDLAMVEAAKSEIPADSTIMDEIAKDLGTLMAAVQSLSTVVAMFIVESLGGEEIMSKLDQEIEEVTKNERS